MAVMPAVMNEPIQAFLATEASRFRIRCSWSAWVSSLVSILTTAFCRLLIAFCNPLMSLSTSESVQIRLESRVGYAAEDSVNG